MPVLDRSVDRSSADRRYRGYRPIFSEMVLTAMFLLLLLILGATDECAPRGFAPVAIGLGLTLIHLIGIPVTKVSVKPARSTGSALFVGGWALAKLWLFWLAPLAGALLSGSGIGCSRSRNPTRAASPGSWSPRRSRSRRREIMAGFGESGAGVKGQETNERLGVPCMRGRRASRMKREE